MTQNNEPETEQWTRTMNQDQNNEPEPERKPEPGLVPIPDLHLEPRCKYKQLLEYFEFSTHSY